MIRIVAVTAALLAASAAFADMGTPPTPPAAAAPAKTIVTKLFSGTKTALGQDIALPATGGEVTVLSYEIPPGAKLPVHMHKHPRYAYVLAGRLKVSTEDGARSFEYGPGDFIIEMLDTWHFGETIGADMVKLLVIDQAPAGESNTQLKQ